MASLTTPAMRILCEEMGCGLTFTEMVSTAGLVHGARKVAALLASSSPGRAFGAQLIGHRVEEMERAALMAEASGAALVDINMGCPARKVVKSGGGAALMRDSDLAVSLVAAVRRGTSLPVTVKIRAGWDQDSVNAPEFAQAMVEAGAAAVTVHGRTKRQVFSGPVDFDCIAAVVDAVDVPVIGNGGIVDVSSAEQMVRATGCAGIMVARGALGRPWIFGELAAWWRGDPMPEPPDADRIRDLMVRHLDLYLAEASADRAVLEMRKHLAWYARGVIGASTFRRALFQLTDPEAVRRHIATFGR
ncbi:MAG: tRNA dihydrouridine synthase DusB [Deltaproteobacteria bacterium]|nr:tRNA dihydrouridine synthase DusB [Deltaproteobacteria bacterium]